LPAARADIRFKHGRSREAREDHVYTQDVPATQDPETRALRRRRALAFAGGLDLTIPHLFAIGAGLLVGGIVLVLIAIVLIVLGAGPVPAAVPARS
jgi:hypothetical protein